MSKQAKMAPMAHSKGPGWAVGTRKHRKEGDTGPRNPIFCVKMIDQATNFWGAPPEWPSEGDMGAKMVVFAVRKAHPGHQFPGFLAGGTI